MVDLRLVDLTPSRRRIAGLFASYQFSSRKACNRCPVLYALNAMLGPRVAALPTSVVRRSFTLTGALVTHVLPSTVLGWALL